MTVHGPHGLQNLIAGTPGPMRLRGRAMESDGLARERAELRGKLAAHQEQIRELQSTVAQDARREQIADGGASSHQEGEQYERDDRVAQLQAELVEVLRENELLRLALGNGPTETQSPRLGHRTVSSTQLASASSSSLTVQQRRDVAAMIRRQENLRKAQTESLQEQLRTLEQERDLAIHTRSDVERRLAESMADLKRLEQVRLRDNREAATDLESWERERWLLNARVEELTAMLENTTGVLDVNLGQVPVHLSPALVATSRRADDSQDAWRAVPADDVDGRVSELRSKLAEMKHETDAAVQRAAEADETAYQWFVRTQQSSNADRDSLSAEVALLHSHIASRDKRDDLDCTKLELLLGNIAAYMDGNLLRFRVVRVFDVWARLAANGKTMRDSFAHLFRGLSKGPTQNVMNGLAKRMRQKTSINMFKVITGLMLRLFRRPPFRAPFSAWAHATSRNRLLWRRSSRRAYATIQSKLRCIMRAWHRVLVRKNRNLALLWRRKSIIAFRVVQQAIHDWSKEVQSASQILFFNRRSRKSHRKTAVSNYFAPWRQYASKHRTLKQRWRSLKATRYYKALLRPFKGWHVIGMRSTRALVHRASAILDSAAMLDPELQRGRVWPLDFTVQLAHLVIFTYSRMRLRRNEDICSKNVRFGYLLRSMQAWRERIGLKLTVQRFCFGRQVRTQARMCASAFWTWAMQHPRRLNLLQLSTGVRASQEHAPAHIVQHLDVNAQQDAPCHVLADESLSMHSTKFLQSLVPLKSVDMQPSEQGTKHMYFLWKKVLAQFESRLMLSFHAKQCRRVFDFWLDYKTQKFSMYRKQTVFQLRWFQTPILIIWKRWSSWTLEERCRKHILFVCLRRKGSALRSQVMYSWKDQRLLSLKTSRQKYAVDKRLALRNQSILHAALLQWRFEKHKRTVFAVAGKRLTKRTEKCRLQKAFLHFLIGIEKVNANIIMRPWTRSSVKESAKEHFMFGIIEDNADRARSGFLLQKAFSFWYQLTKRRLEIAARCHRALYTRPQLCAFRAWSIFARVKHKMLEGLGESHARYVHAVMDSCYDMIKAWGWFTRVRRNVKKQLQTHMRRIARCTLRPLIQFWSAYMLTRRALFHTAVGHLRRRYRQLSREVIECWHEYARVHGWKKRKADRFLARLEIQRGNIWLNNAVRFWEAYAVSRMSLAIRATTFADLGDAKHCKTLMQSTLQAWHTFAVSMQLVFDLSCRGRSRQLRRRVATWRQYLWLHQMKMGVKTKYCATLVQKACSTWVIYTRHKARLARKGVLVMQRREQHAIARAFEGLCHCMVTAEIASQYRSCLKDIKVSSCAGHAFRVWLKYLRQCSMQVSYQAACHKRRVRALMTLSFREWWVRTGRIRRVRMILHTIHMLNRHLLRRCVYLWRRSTRETRIQRAQMAKAMIREAQCLCYIVFRLWEQHVQTLLMDVNVRIVAMEEDQLRFSLSRWWNWCSRNRNQRLRRWALHERRETQILNQFFRTWCHYVSRHHRERRRRRLDVYVHAQHGRITQTGGLAYKLTFRVLNVFKARTSARRYLRQMHWRQQSKRDRAMLHNAFCGFWEFADLRQKCSVTLCQRRVRRSFAVCRWALTGWYLRWQRNRSIQLWTLRAEKVARNRRLSKFLKHWWDLLQFVMRWSVTLFQRRVRRSFAVCRWALTGWYLRWQRNRSIQLSALRAEKFARNRRLSKFLKHWWDLLQFVILRERWSVTLFQRHVRRSFAVCRWALTGWYLRWQRNCSVLLSALRAERYARNRRLSQLLKQWWNQAIREAHLKSSHEFRHLTWMAVQNDRRHCSNLCEKFFEIWYESKCARNKHRGRICKAVAWSKVRMRGRIYRGWNWISMQHKCAKVRQLQSTARNFRKCLLAVLSEWITVHYVSKSVQKHRRRFTASWLRELTIMAFNKWNSRYFTARSLAISYSRVRDAHAKILRAQTLLAWAAVVKIQDAFCVVMDKSDGIREREVFGRWLNQVRRSLFLHHSGTKLQSRFETRRKVRLCTNVLATLRETVNNRKFSELRTFDDTLVDYKHRVVRVMRMVCLKRFAGRLLRRWAELREKNKLFITKLEPEWVLVQVWLRISAEQLAQHALELRSGVQEECLLAIRQYDYRLNTSKGRDALDAAIQILDIDIQKKVAVVKVGRVKNWSASPHIIANYMVRGLSIRQAAVVPERVTIHVDRAQVSQSFFVKLHRWWLIRGRRLLRAWSGLVGTRHRLRLQELVRTKKLRTRKARVTLCLWLNYAQHQSHRHAVLLGALTSTLRRLLLASFRCWYRTWKGACVAQHTCKRAVAKGRVAVQYPLFRAWYWFCDQRRGKDDVARIVIQEWTNAQTSVQRKHFNGWRQRARDRVSLARSIHVMSERVLVRLDMHVMRRALVSWRAHTKGTLAGRWRNFGLAQISHAVHVNKVMIVDHFILQSMRFSFIRWALCTVQSRPLERLVVSQLKRHSRALLTFAFDVLSDHRASRYFSGRAILINDTRKKTRTLFCVLEHWKLATGYGRQTAMFFVRELRLRKVSKMIRGWSLIIKAQDRLAFFVVKNGRRLCSKMLRLWKELLSRQDRLMECQARRIHVHRHRITTQYLEKWRCGAAYLYRLRSLFHAVAARDKRNSCNAFAHAWRRRVKLKKRFTYVLSLLQRRRTLKILHRVLRTMRKAQTHPPLLRRAVLLVVGQMNATRCRHLAFRIFGSWRVNTRVHKVWAINFARIQQSNQKRQLVRCVDWWLDAVAASAKQKEVNCRNQIHSHLEALAQSHQDSVLAKEEALQIRREAAEVVEACKADSAQLVDTVVQQSAHLAEQAAQLETLHAELHTQEGALKQMASDLDNERKNVALRDGWLQNLGTEMDKNLLLLRKERDRTKSLEQMIQAYEKEFKSLHDSAPSSGGSSARLVATSLRDKSVQDYSHDSRQALGRPQESARSLVPRLQLSARSSRSSEKENTGPHEI